MPKLTLNFKGQHIQVYHFDSGIITIGSDADNTIRIDNLGIAPKHAIIDLDHSDGPHLFQEDEHFPLQVNNRKISNHLLKHGDTIQLGKYTIDYASDEQVLDSPVLEAESEPEPELELLFKDSLANDANLQLLNGKNIGRLIPLKQALTRLGKPGKGVAVIARRKEGYFLSSLEGGEKIKINGAILGEQTLPLSHGDKLEIDKHKMLFTMPFSISSSEQPGP